jgi:tRNA (guanine26-N2/guanine27-N2)-dimethyltransferase
MNCPEGHISVEKGDANSLLGSFGAPRKRFDVVDIDPFGSPAPFLDSAIRALRDGGLLALTATDMAPLCGVHPKACIRKYGGKPLRTEYCHELAVRLLAGCLATVAAKHEIGMRVVFCHSSDHYIRLYATLGYGAKKADDSINEMGYVLHCFNCFQREIVRGLFRINHRNECPECHSQLSMAGPLWIGKIFSTQFTEQMQEESKRKIFRQKAKIQKILALANNEVDAPITYYVLDRISRKLGLPVPSVRNVLKCLEEAGFQGSLTHFSPNGIRTNASATDMKRILRKAQEHAKE